MAEGRDRHQWDHTACLIAALVNVWCEKKISPEEIHPYHAKPADRVERLNRKESMAYLKAVYGKGNGR